MIRHDSTKAHVLRVLGDLSGGWCGSVCRSVLGCVGGGRWRWIGCLVCGGGGLRLGR